MATFTQIRLVRLKLNEPAGSVDIKSVTSLPTTPAFKTVYYNSVDQVYYVHNGVSYINADIRIIDELISSWIDEYGEARALVHGWKYLVAQIGEEMRVESDESGADTVKFTSLQTMFNYYKGMIAQATADADALEDVSTGTMYKTADPEIAGGLV